jgi:hypothetical protein
VSATARRNGGIENEIRTIPGLGFFTAHPVGRRFLVFSRRQWLNSCPPAVRHHFGGRALLHRRHANRLEIRDDGFPVWDRYVADESANL